MFTRGSLTLFRVRGVPIRAHWSLLLVAPYLAATLSERLGAVLGISLAVALFASVAVHELAHVWVARRYGGRVQGITLMLLGGVSHITRMPPRPRSEALMAAAGPAASVALGLVFAVAYGHAGGAIRTFFLYLASINLSLGVFNLLPAFPMDGGRVLRAVLASRQGNLAATRTAARIGRALAVVMAVIAIGGGNLLLLLVAVFVYAGAGSELEGARALAALDGVLVRDLVPMAKAPALELDATLADALPRMRMFGRQELIVVDPGGEPVGVLTIADLAQVTPGARLSIPVRDALRRLRGRHMVISADEPAAEALELAAESGAAFVVVIEPRTGVRALLTANDLATAVALRIADERPVLRTQARPGAA